MQLNYSEVPGCMIIICMSLIARKTLPPPQLNTNSDCFKHNILSAVQHTVGLLTGCCMMINICSRLNADENERKTALTCHFDGK